MLNYNYKSLFHSINKKKSVSRFEQHWTHIIPRSPSDRYSVLNVQIENARVAGVELGLSEE